MVTRGRVTVGKMNFLRLRWQLLVTACFASCCFGQFLPVHGHRLFLQCAGSAPGPTVILVAGAGGTTHSWSRVQPRVAEFARVCSYDRAGLGKSSPSPQAQSAGQIVDDLAGLLAAVSLSPPYVLVGHSIGGIYIRQFEQRYPAQVTGMILVDSSHEEQIWRFAKDDPASLAEYPDWRDTAVMRSKGYLPPEERLQWHFHKSLIVLEHGIPPEPVWHQLQQDLASRSPQGKLIVAKQSRHYIQEQDPELVIQSIRGILARIASQEHPQ